MRYEELVKRPSRFLALTGLTEKEFEALVPAFGAAFERHMDEWTMEGRRREGRLYSQYKNNPLPRTEDKLLFILVYLKQAPSQELQGELFGLSQSNTNKWIHVLLPVLEQSVQGVGEQPARRPAELAARLEARLAEDEAATELEAQAVEEETTEPAPRKDDALTRAFFSTMALIDHFRVHRTQATGRITSVANTTAIR